MDARERLRRYLEQRREMGERELVLDDLPVAEVMRIVGASATEPGATRPSSARSRATPAREPFMKPEPSVKQEPTPSAPAPVTRPPTTVAPPESRIASAASIDEVAGLVAGCTRCPLHRTATKPVPGTGHPTADLVCVGEAPGAKEDETGEPFVGAAGQLLTKILAAINLSRSDVFICNVLKHRPPGNRNPLPDEVLACTPYLTRQLELLHPKAILALGTFAAQTLLNTKMPIGKLRGTTHQYQGIPLVVTYHPAALLRNPSWKRPTWEDVQLVRRVLDSSAA